MPPLTSGQRDAVRRFVEATGTNEKTAQKVGPGPLASSWSPGNDMLSLLRPDFLCPP